MLESHIASFVVAAAAALVLTAADGPLGPPGRPPLYYHYQNISGAGDFEAGHARGHPTQWIARHEHQHGASNRGHVRWGGVGSSGLRVWELNHVQLDHGHGGHGHTGYLDRKSGQGQQEDQDGHDDPDCLLRRLGRLGRRHGRPRHQRSADATLITRDCEGNPLEPPGVRLNPGPPRPPPQPRPPPPPSAWSLADETRPPLPPATTDVYLHGHNKRGGRAGWGGPGGWGAAPQTWSARSGSGALDPPRGFEPTAEDTASADMDMEGREDHLRGMTHADKLLMFGDGSYGAASTPAFKLQPFKVMKAPTVVKVSPMKNVVKVKLAPMRSPLSGLSGLGGLGSLMGSLKPAMTASKPVVARVKPMVVLVRPMSSNRMPNGGKGPANAARPVPIAKWFASMWGGG